MSEESESKRFRKRHAKLWLVIKIGLIFGFSLAIAIISLEYAIPISLFTMLSSDGLKAVIEIEASLLAFFAIVAVYRISALDSKLDRLDERIDDSSDKENWQRAKKLEERYGMISRKRNGEVIAMMSTLFAFLISFFLSIVAFTVKTVNGDTSIIYQANTLAVAFLLIGIFAVFVLMDSTRKGS
jgi:hypothetical protein